MFNLEIDKITKVLFGGFILGWVALSSTGCGSNSNVQQIVTKLTLRAYALNGDNWVEAKASLNTGNFILASINLPVLDPRHPDLVYGTLNIAPVLCSGICKGNADLTLGLNMTELTHAPAGDAVLPNGAPLPVGGLGQTPMIALPVSKTGARVYFAFGPGVALMGTAIPFAQLDPAGHYVPGASLFQPFQIGPVALAAGMFFGAQTNTTGVGLFIDLSSVITLPPIVNSTSMSTMAAAESAQSNTLQLLEVKPSAKVQKKIFKKLYELNQQGLTLEVQ